MLKCKYVTKEEWYANPQQQTPNWGEPKEDDQAARTTLGHALF